MPALGTQPRLHAKWNDEECDLFIMRLPETCHVKQWRVDWLICYVKYMQVDLLR